MEMIQPINIDFSKIDTGVVNTKFLRTHYTNHYLVYIKNINNYLKENIWTDNIYSLEELIYSARPNLYLYNNAAQIWNHEFFFTQFSSKPNHKIGPKLEYFIYSKYDSIENFIKDCITKGSNHFGSGYLWIYLDERMSFIIETGNNAENLVKRKKCIPILCIDLWEHSYYLSHNSNKKQYLIDLFETAIDWSLIENRLKVE